MGTFLLVVFLLYFFPTWIALFRGKRNKGSIFVLNFFLGWTLVGWVVSLAWALAHDGVMVVQSPQSQNSPASELQKLADLKNQGAIPSEEFEAGKKKILNS
jgi:hypothetical protein